MKSRNGERDSHRKAKRFGVRQQLEPHEGTDQSAGHSAEAGPEGEAEMPLPVAPVAEQRPQRIEKGDELNGWRHVQAGELEDRH